MKIVSMLLLLAILPTSASAMSFLDKEHAEKLAKEAARTSGLPSVTTEATSASTVASDGMNPLQLFASPLQPGGKGLQVNWMNVLRVAAPKLAKKLDKGRSLIDLWVETQVAADEEIRALNNDDRPDRDYKKKLKALKDRKREEYRLRGVSMALAAGMRL